MADNIANPQYTWDFIKQKMVRRFGCSTAQPLIEAKDLSLQCGQTLEDYYRAKVRLLNQTTLSEQEKVQMLTAGLPHSWKVSLAPIPITTTDVWFESAQRVEAVHSKPAFQKDFKPQSPHKPHHTFQMESNPSTAKTQYTAPYIPLCKFCHEQGIVVNHWHSECPIKAKYRQSSSGQRHSVPNQLNHQNRRSNQTNESTDPQTSPDTSSTSSDSSEENNFCSSTSTEQVHPFLTVDVTLDGQPLNAIVDSASTISIISEKTFKSLSKQMVPNSPIKITHISGQTQTLGSIQANLQIAHKSHETKFHVIANFKYPLLLGLDTGKLFGLSLDLKQGKVSVQSNPPNNEYSSPQTPQQPMRSQATQPQPQLSEPLPPQTPKQKQSQQPSQQIRQHPQQHSPQRVRSLTKTNCTSNQSLLSTNY